MRPFVRLFQFDNLPVSTLRISMLLFLLVIPLGSALAAGTVIPGTSEGTGEKPQSKLWWSDQTWWAILSRSGKGLHFYEFNDANQTWQASAFMDANVSSSGRADVKWNGQELFVLGYTSNPKLLKYTYDRDLRTWNLLPGFPVSLPVSSGSETMVLDQDSNGRLWTTWEGGNNIWVAWSTNAEHTQWSSPLSIRKGVSSDDISSVVAFDGKIGVFWSDQKRDEFGFRIHRDSNAPDSWESAEVADSGSGRADDHISVKVSATGKVFALTKDDNDKMFLHRRNTNGDWTTKSGVISGSGTRGSLMICDDSEKLYVAYTDWSSSDKIKLKRASYGSMKFSTYVSSFISGDTFNNATGAKQVLPQGVYMGMAGGAGDVYWNGWGTLPPDGPPPPAAPELFTANLQEVETSEIIRPDLILNLPMDEGSGSTTMGTTRYSHEGSLDSVIGKGQSGPAWTTGQGGTALHFDGSNWVTIASTSALQIPGSFTLEAWVRRYSGVSGNGTILSKGRSNHRNYQMLLLENGRVQFKWEVPGGANRGVTSSQALTAGAWQHVTCIYDQDAGRSRLYIDGRLDASISDSGTPIVNDEPLHLGRRISGSTPKEYLTADLDGIRIWRGVAYTGDFTPGELPTFPAGTDPAHQIALQWNAPTDETRPLTYNLAMQANGSGWMTLAQDLTTTSWTHRTPVYGTNCYEVRAFSTDDGLTGQPATVCIDYIVVRAEPKRAAHDEPTPAKGSLSVALGMKAVPNPFNPQTEIQLRLPQSGWVDLAIFDVRGRRVAQLQQGYLQAGAYQFPWNARSDRGGRLSSGVYFLRAKVPGETLRRRLVLLK